MKIVSPQISPIFCPNLGKDKKKGLHLNLVRFFAQDLLQIKNKGFGLPFVYLNLLPKLQRGGGGMPQFCIPFCANYTILATQRVGQGPMPPPP